MCFFQGSFPAFHGSHLIEVLRALWSGYFRDSPCRSAGQRFFRRQWITWRAQTWVNDHVPYNQDLKHDGHHQDSSGYVSFAWNLKQPGTSPSGMGAVSHSIPFDGLQPGDALKNSEAHSMLFIKWVNQSKGTFIAYEEANPATGTREKTLTLNKLTGVITQNIYYSYPGHYTAMRPNGI